MRSCHKVSRALKPFAVLSLCVLIGLTYGCSLFGKKEEPKFKPGGEWLEGMRTRVDTAISDPAKKNDMLSIINQVEKDLMEIDRTIQEFYADIGRLKNNYGATRDDYKKVVSEYETKRKKFRDRIIDSWFKMRDLSTSEEWERLTWYSEKKGVYKQTVRQPGQ